MTPWDSVSGPARPDTAIPAPVRAVAASRAVRAVWQNELGGITFEVGAGTERCFVKWAPAASGIDLQWNYGPGWEGLLLDAYGVPPDPDRTRYYRLLWDLGP